METETNGESGPEFLTVGNDLQWLLSYHPELNELNEIWTKTIKNIFSNRHQECFANRFEHPLRVHNLGRSQYDEKRSSLDTDDDRFRQESARN
jgi:hypothetical protein